MERRFPAQRRNAMPGSGFRQIAASRIAQTRAVMSARWFARFCASRFSSPSVFLRPTRPRAKPRPKPRGPAAAAVEAESASLPPAELTEGFLTRDSDEGIGDLLEQVWSPGAPACCPQSPHGRRRPRRTGRHLASSTASPDQAQHYLGANSTTNYRDTGSFNYDRGALAWNCSALYRRARELQTPTTSATWSPSETQTTVSQTGRTTSSGAIRTREDH
jgi:hypothetical protein